MHGDNPLTHFDGTRARETITHPGLLRVAAIFAFALFLASHLPPVFVAAALRDLLFIAAAVTSVLALVRGDRVWAPCLTRWDEAAILTAMALVAGLFVDPAALQSAGQQLMSDTTATTGGSAT